MTQPPRLSHSSGAPRLLLWAFALALGLTACDCDGGEGKGDASTRPDVTGPDGGDTGDCESDNPPASCGAACTADGDCGVGTHCGEGDECTAECGPPGSDCTAELVCDLTGRCRPRIDGGGGDGDACVDVDLAPERLVPNVILLVDKSGSMDEDDIPMGQTTLRRWNALRELLIGRCSDPRRDPSSCGSCDSLVSGSVGIVGRTHEVVNYGLMIYPGGSGEAACAERLTVDVAPNNYSAVRQMFMQTSCSGGTPTQAAFDDVMADLYDATSDGPTIVILATDGAPNHCTCRSGFSNSNSNCGNCCLSDRIATENGVVDAVEAAHQDHDVTTYVIAISDDITGNPHFQEVANVGQGMPRSGGGSATLYEASEGDALEAALDEIITSSISCDIDLHATVTAADLCKGTVTLDGTPLECNGPHGYSRVDDRHIRLNGDACESWKIDADAVLQAKWPCGAVIIIPPG